MAGVCDVVAEEFVVSVLGVVLVLGAADWLLVSVDGVVLGAADWLLVSVAGVVLVDDDVLLDGVVVLEDDELVAPVWALSFVAVPVVEVAGAVLCPAGVVSAGCVVSAGAVLVWLGLAVGAAAVDEVWSVTGG